MKKIYKELCAYLGIYRAWMAISASIDFSFRTSFVLVILMDIIFYFVVMQTAEMIFMHTAIPGWPLEWMRLFLAFGLAINQLHMMLFAEGFWQVAADIRLGQFDYILLRPKNLVFNIFCRFFRPAAACLYPLVTSGLIYFSWQCGLSVLEFLGLYILLLLAFILSVLIEVFISTFMIITEESIGINFFRLQLQSIARWPASVYPKWFRAVFIIFLPSLLCTNLPLEMARGFSWWSSFCILLMACSLYFAIVQWSWHFVLRFYHSASS